MSQNSAATVDQQLPRNNNQQRQNGMRRRRLMNQLANRIMRLPSSPVGRRTVMIPNQGEIVTTLSVISRFYRQAIYVWKVKGYVSMAKVVTIPTGNIMTFNGRGKILYASGWFHPMITTNMRTIEHSRANGVLNVSISDFPHGLAVANKLIASGFVEVDIFFDFGPGLSVVQPDAPAGGQERPQPPVRQI